MPCQSILSRQIGSSRSKATNSSSPRARREGSRKIQCRSHGSTYLLVHSFRCIINMHPDPGPVNLPRTTQSSLAGMKRQQNGGLVERLIRRSRFFRAVSTCGTRSHSSHSSHSVLSVPSVKRAPPNRTIGRMGHIGPNRTTARFRENRTLQQHHRRL